MKDLKNTFVYNESYDKTGKRIIAAFRKLGVSTGGLAGNLEDWYYGLDGFVPPISIKISPPEGAKIITIEQLEALANEPEVPEIPELKGIECWVSNTNPSPDENDGYCTLIIGKIDGKYMEYDLYEKILWNYATPVNKTVQPPRPAQA